MDQFKSFDDVSFKLPFSDISSFIPIVVDEFLEQ
jgi:hypothetical protein